MQNIFDPGELRLRLLSIEQLEDRGWRTRAIRRAVVEGGLVRIAVGVYVRAADWRVWYSETRRLALLLAVAARQPPDAVWAGKSAAVLHGLPVFGAQDPRPELILLTTEKTKSTTAVRRSVSRLDERDITELHGFRCTTVDRTLIDLARRETPELALVAADAALRRRFGPKRPGRAEDDSAACVAESWKAELIERLRRGVDRRGVRRAERLLSLVDRGADSPAESVSRFRLVQLGYRVETQVPVEGPDGGSYWVDFEIAEVGVLAEVDGRSKYMGSKPDDADSAAELVYLEKRREDWIRGRTAKRFVRWSPADTRTLEEFTRMLRHYRVPLPTRGRSKGLPC